MRMENSNALLTILLFLKDREAFTYRWLQWMNENRCPYPIFIADGSQNNNIELHLQNSKNYPMLQYKYLYYGEDSSYEKFYQKAQNALSRIETKYVVMADNDDFFCIDTFREHLDFLENNHDYVGSYGKVDMLFLYNKKSHVHSVINKRANSLAYKQDTEYDRLIYQMKNYRAQNYYAIYTKEHLLTLHQFILEKKFQNIEIHEYTINFGMTLFGKINYLDKAYLFRQLNTSSNTQLYKNTLLHKICFNRFKEEYMIYIENNNTYLTLNTNEEKNLSIEYANFLEFLINFGKKEKDAYFTKLFHSTKLLRTLYYFVYNIVTQKTQEQIKLETFLNKILITKNQEFFKTLN